VKTMPHQRMSIRVYRDLPAGTHHRRKRVGQTRLRAGVAASMFERRPPSPYLFTTMREKPTFRTSQGLLRDRPTTISREARSTTMDRHSRGPPVVSSRVADSPAWNDTNKCVNRICKHPMHHLPWRPGPEDPATIKLSPGPPSSRLCRSEHPATASSIAQIPHAYIWKIKKTFPRLLSNATRTRNSDTLEGKLDRSCQTMISQSPGLSSRLLFPFQHNSRTAKLWEP